MAKKKFNPEDKVFIFDRTRGDGIPGLPHEIRESELENDEQRAILEGAIANGSYVEKGSDARIDAQYEIIEPAGSQSDESQPEKE